MVMSSPMVPTADMEATVLLLTQSAPFTDAPFHFVDIGNGGDSLRGYPIEGVKIGICLYKNKCT